MGKEEHWFALPMGGWLKKACQVGEDVGVILVVEMSSSGKHGLELVEA